jgi:CheY-like chemotaxis protein
MPSPDRDTLPLALFRPPVLLIVESSDRTRATLCRLARALGYEVRGAPNARHALRVLRRYPGLFRFILADACLPSMDGGELAERVRELEPHAKIALTADDPAGRAAELLAAYPELPVLRKPVGAASLGSLLRQLVGPPEAAIPLPGSIQRAWGRRDRKSVE